MEDSLEFAISDFLLPLLKCPEVQCLENISIEQYIKKQQHNFIWCKTILLMMGIKEPAL